MSQLKVNDAIDRHITRLLNEEFFDEHPNSFNIERIRLSKNIIIFIDTQTPETFMIRITYDHIKECQNYQKLYQYIIRDSNLQIDCMRDRNILFLRKLLF
jgi:hypothetical protein